MSKLKRQRLSFTNKAMRALWWSVWCIFFRPTPRNFHRWRCFLLRLFGARLGKNVHPYPSARVWAPWNLTMGDDSCLSDWVDCYSVDKIQIGRFTTISQYSFLCTASHDHSLTEMPLVIAPIRIGDYVWITADVFVAPGVTIGEGTVVTARSSVFHDLPEWRIARGNPAAVISHRILADASGTLVSPEPRG